MKRLYMFAGCIVLIFLLVSFIFQVKTQEKNENYPTENIRKSSFSG
jgi:hypothetical protein